MLVRRADHAERGAVARGGERARVAVGEQARARGHERGAVGAHRPVGREILGQDGLGLDEQPRRAARRPRARRSAAAVRRIRSRAQKRLTAVGRVAASPLIASSRSASSAEWSVARLARAASTMPNAAATPIAGAPRTTRLADGLRDLGPAPAGALDLLGGQAGLVDQDQAAILPADGRDRHGPRRARRSDGERRSTRKSLSREAAPRTSAIREAATPSASASRSVTARLALPVRGRRGHPHSQGVALPAHHLVAPGAGLHPDVQQRESASRCRPGWHPPRGPDPAAAGTCRRWPAATPRAAAGSA